MIQCGFFNSVEGDRTYSAEDMSTMYEGIVTDGVLRDIGTELKVSPCSPVGMRVSVGSGKAILDNKWMRNTEDLVLTLEESETLPRIDRIVLEVNYISREFYISVKKGTAGASPKEPSLEDSAAKKEIPLAAVRVYANTAEITEDDIIDERTYATVNNVVLPSQTVKIYHRSGAYVCDPITLRGTGSPGIYGEKDGSVQIIDVDIQGVHHITMYITFAKEVTVPERGIWVGMILPENYRFPVYADVSIGHSLEETDALPQVVREKDDLFVNEIIQGRGCNTDKTNGNEMCGYIRIMPSGPRNKFDTITASFITGWEKTEHIEF